MNTPASTPPSSMSSSADQQPAQASKRIRLSLACNQCRKRKVRCDAETPKCHNCVLRGDVCETTNPRKPEEVVIRRWATKNVPLPPTRSSERSEPNASESPARRESMSAGIQTGTPPPSTIDENPPHSMSWVARAYIDNTAAGDHAEQNHGENTTHSNNLESPDVTINTDDSPHRLKMIGSSSLQSLTMFLDIFLKRRSLQPVGPHFRYGMQYVEEFHIPLSLHLPDLPDQTSLNSYMSVFMERLYPLYPIFDPHAFGVDLNRLSTQNKSHGPGSLPTLVSGTDIPVLASIYAIISIAADEGSPGLTETGHTFLTAAYSLYGHIVSLPYLGSVQALLLISIALRGRSKEGQGWQVLGQAIRIAHSIGLHHHVGGGDRQENQVGASPGYQHDAQLHSRIWWTAYGLEKLVELEIGRPSAIHDSDCNQILPSPIHRDDAQNAPDFFHSWASLARIMSQISEHIYRNRNYGQGSYKLLHDTGKLDKALTDWAQSLPEGYRPGHDIFCPDEHWHLATFLSIHYHQAMITLHRAAIVFPTHLYQNAIKECSPNLPSYLRLQRSSDVCIQSARAIVKLILDALDHHIDSRIFTVTPPLLASIVLALNILKHPQTRMLRSDLELISTACHYAEDEYNRVGQDPDFIAVCRLLRDGVTQAATAAAAGSSSSSHREHRPSTSSLSQNSVGFFSQHSGMDLDALVNEASGQQHYSPLTNEVFADPFEGVALEDLWTMLGSDGLLDDQGLFGSTFTMNGGSKS